MNIYELTPIDGRKSFYGKAHVMRLDDGIEVLLSYKTPVMMRKPGGTYVRLWDGWSATTGRHISAFSGMNKAAYFKLPYSEGAEIKWVFSLK